VAHALARLLAEKRETSACAAAKTAFTGAWSFDEFAGKGSDLARLVVDVAIAPEIAGVVEDYFFVLGLSRRI
jgi:hypothetical protein